MILIDCIECGAWISNRAARSPRCDRPELAQHEKLIGARLVSLCALGVLLALSIIALNACLDGVGSPGLLLLSTKTHPIHSVCQHAARFEIMLDDGDARPCALSCADRTYRWRWLVKRGVA